MQTSLKEAIMLIQNQQFDQAVDILLDLKQSTDVNTDTDNYLKICQLIISCGGSEGKEDLFLDNLEEVYLISSATSANPGLLFDLETKLMRFYLFDLKTE